MTFIRNLILLSLVLAGAIFALNHYVPGKFASPNAYYAVAYFFVLTLIVHQLSLRASVQSPQTFIRFFMGSTAVRLMIHLLVAVSYRLLFRESATSFLIAFMLLYLIFQVFEVSALLKHLRKK